MDTRISPAKSVRGTLRLPGDKSISHRYGILASLAEGKTTIHNFSTGADCHSTLGAMAGLGAGVVDNGNEVEIDGRGLDGLRQPGAQLDAGNSGSTIRMLGGVLAAQPFASSIGGDESLSRRPMVRIMKPLAEMGASIAAREGRFPPLEIHGGPLRPITYPLPVASAQVKTCVLFAGMFADGTTTVIEPVRTRDHSELALREFGADIAVDDLTIKIEGRPRLTGSELTVPGDISSAAFFLVAAMLLPGSRLVMDNVGLNPTRAALIDFLISMGGAISVTNRREVHGEAVGDIEVEHGTIRGGVVEKGLTAALIDEIPVLAVLGAASEQGLEVRDAAELRVKETDRIESVVTNLRRMGVSAEEAEDGFRVPGGQRFAGAEVDSFGDHRIAMAFSVAALAGENESIIKNSAAASISYPEFFDTLRLLTEA